MKSKDKHWQSSGRQGLPKGEWDLSSILVLACWLPGCRSRLNHHCLIFKSDIHWILIIWLKEAEDINCVFSNLPSLFKGTIQPTLYWPWVISNSLLAAQDLASGGLQKDLPISKLEIIPYFPYSQEEAENVYSMRCATEPSLPHTDSQLSACSKFGQTS